MSKKSKVVSIVCAAAVVLAAAVWFFVRSPAYATLAKAAADWWEEAQFYFPAMASVFIILAGAPVVWLIFRMVRKKRKETPDT